MMLGLQVQVAAVAVPQRLVLMPPVQLEMLEQAEQVPQTHIVAVR
jgi:hypothetical protein